MQFLTDIYIVQSYFMVNSLSLRIFTLQTTVDIYIACSKRSGSGARAKNKASERAGKKGGD